MNANNHSYATYETAIHYKLKILYSKNFNLSLLLRDYPHIIIKVIPIKIATTLIQIPDILYFWLVFASS